MTGREVARTINIGRVALGGVVLLVPRRALRGWIGDGVDAPGMRAVARALGVREAVLGAIALHTLDNPQVGPRWQRTLALCDGVDFAATLAARRELPRLGVVGVGLMAGVAAGAQLWAAGQLASALVGSGAAVVGSGAAVVEGGLDADPGEAGPRVS